MKKAVLRNMLCCLLACLLLCGGVLPALAGRWSDGTPAENAHLHFDRNGRFRILNFSDFQGGKKLDARVKVFIRQAMYKAQPDLVVLTGDNIFGSYVHEFDETRAAIAEYMDIFEALGVPVAFVFGNHDDQGDAILKDRQLEEIYSQYKVNITYDADVHLDGCGTCNVPIYGSRETDRVKFNLWMFDTGSTLQNDYMRKNQLDWYVNKSELLKAGNGGEAVPSIAFQHIIVKEIYDVLIRKGINSYILPETAQAGSVMRESPSANKSVDAKEFSILRQQGDVIAIVSGHDHRNSFVVPCDGIDLINTPAAGFYKNSVYHGDDDTRGARIIDIYEPGVSSKTERYSTEMMILNDYTQPQYFHIPASTGKYVKKIALCKAETEDFGGSADAAMAAAYGDLAAELDAANGNGVALWADLNAGADILDSGPDNHTVICMGYSLTEDPDEAMRDLALGYDDEDDYGWFVWWAYVDETRIRTDDDGRNWTSYIHNPRWTNFGQTSLCYNLNDGTKGKQISLAANYDGAGSPLTEIRLVNTGRHDTIRMSDYPGYQLVHAVFGSETGADVADLNKSAWGDYIYALYKTADHALSRVSLNTLPLQDAYLHAAHRLKTDAAAYPDDCLARLQSAMAAADAILDDLRGDNMSTVYDQAAIDAAAYQIEAWLNIQALKEGSCAATVTFDANGGVCGEQSRTILCGAAVGELPTVSRAQTANSGFQNALPIAFRFAGWFTEREGGTQITPETIFTAQRDQTWYAHWENGTGGKVNPEYPGIIADPKAPVDGAEVDHQKYVPADVNGDGALDLKDLTLLTRHLVGGWNVEADLTYADVNADGNIDLRDVVLLRRYLAGGWGVELVL